MHWAPCLRIDLPADAGATTTFEMTLAAGPLLDALEMSVIGRLNVAVSAAAIEAFEAHGQQAFLARIARLVDDGRIELLATAAHDALLPLLPTEETNRQLALNDEANVRVFGELYRPTSLWSPALAISPKVTAAAASRGLSGLLVDEAAMRVWPARLAGDRIDAVRGVPGLFLYPASRTLSDAFESGVLRRHVDWDHLHLDARLSSPRYVVTTLDLRPTRRPRALAQKGAFDGSVRLDELLRHFPRDRSVAPLPSARRSTVEDLGLGLPFAAWYAPSNPIHALQWRLAARMADIAHEAERSGLRAHPMYTELRRAVDTGWRNDWWLAASHVPRDMQRLLGGVRRREEVIASFVRMLPSSVAEELHQTCRLLLDEIVLEDVRGGEAVVPG